MPLRRFVTFLALLITLLASAKTYAAPETWIQPAATVFGNESGKFGLALACSSAVPGLNHSYIAVSSPLANGGLGKVEIIDPDGTSVQTLNGISSERFGQSVAFVKDINGDSIQELLVGEPGNGGANGHAYIFLSTQNPLSPFSLGCSISDIPGTGDFVMGTSFSALPNAVHVIISNSANSAVTAYYASYAAGICSFSFEAGFSQSGPTSSRFGQSVAEIFDSDSVLLIGAPQFSSNAGRVYSKRESMPLDIRYSGASLEQMGVSMVARSLGGLTDSIAFNAPFSAANGTVYVKTQSGLSFSDVCSQDIPMSDLPNTAAQSLVHMGSVLDSLAGVSGGGVTFASYRSEIETGGSLGLFGAKDNICTEEKQINNCAFDQSQGQGQANAGGPNCADGSTNLLVVGAPGWQSDQGRVDIYREGDELPAAVPCTAPTHTPTPAPSATPTKTPTATPNQGYDQGDDPILLKPSRTPPAPKAIVNNRTLTITAPQFFSRRFNVVKYIFFITFRSAITSKLSAKALENIEAFNKRIKRYQITARRNRITQRDLAPGIYTIRYRVQFKHKHTGVQTLGRLSRATAIYVR